jgi:hypothetical protein
LIASVCKISLNPEAILFNIFPFQTTLGGIGFYVADTSGGDFANLTITKGD